MSANAVRERIEAENRRRPGIAELARHLSLAVRVEPPLLRRIRVQFAADVLPEGTADAGLESDLWFSGLVESRGPWGFVLDHDVADTLRRDLARDGDCLEHVLEVMREVHRDAPDSVRLEEEVAALALPRGDSSEIGEGALASIEEKLHSAVLAMTEGDAERAYDVARWALRALPRLPETVRTTDSGILLGLVASAHLEGRQVIPVADRPQGLPQGAAWSFSRLTSLPAVEVGMRVHERAVEWVNPADSDALTFEAPRTDPVYVELRWHESGRDVRRGAGVRPGEWVELPAGAADLRLRTIAGREFAFESADRAARASADDDILRSSCVLIGASGIGFFVARDRVLTRLGAFGAVAARTVLGQAVTMEFRDSELLANVAAMRDGFCLLALPRPVDGARVLQLAAQPDAPAVGATWHAYGRSAEEVSEIQGWIEAGRADGALLLRPGVSGAVATHGSPVVVGESVIGQIDETGPGGELIAMPAALIDDFLDVAATDQDRRLTVFISHTPDGAEFAEGLEFRLRSRGVSVLRGRGRGLATAEEWSPQLYEWLATCDAAVVLLSQGALVSQWMRKEITILRWRRSLNPELGLIPVLLRGTDSTALFEAGLADVQAIRAESQDELAVREVEDRLEMITTSSDDRGLLALQRRLASLFVTLPASVLEDIGRSLDWELGRGEPRDGSAAELAGVVIGRFTAEDPLATLEALAPVLEWASAASDALLELLPLLVDPGAAAQVRQVIEGPAGQRAVALQTMEAPIAQLYLARAWLGERGARSMIFSGVHGEAMMTEYLAEIFSLLRRDLRSDREHVLSDEDVNELLSRQPVPRVVILPASSLDSSLVAEIQHRFPQLGLLLMTGAERRDDFRQARVTMLPEPAEEAQEEMLRVRDILELQLRRSRTDV